MSSLFRLTILFPALVTTAVCSTAIGENDEPRRPEAARQETVPQGKVHGPFEWTSQIFPGTVRDFWVYVPAQYDPQKPACVMIVQDGLRRAEQWKIPTVLDQLIHEGDVPVQIGIFINPGVVPAANADSQPRFNRSFEYDSMGDRYARFLIEEILPEVSKTYSLSDDPNDYAIAGASSGAICAFTAAWERPDRFRRVLSTIGTYVSLRGGNEYPVLVRKFENKPIRVFLQDGRNDLNLYAGSWWVANQAMLSSLQFAGYDVAYAWGDGGHDSKQSTAIMPDILKWLWRDYPQPIKPGVPPKRRTELVIPDEGWELCGQGYGYADSPAVNADGDVFFADIKQGRIHKCGAGGQVTLFASPGKGIGGLMFGPDGNLYGCQRETKQIVRFDGHGQQETVLDDAPCNDLVMLHDGSGYFTDPQHRRVWRFTAGGRRTQVDTGISFPNGIITSPDQSLLFVSDTIGRFGYSFQIRADGTLASKQEYGHVHVRDDQRTSGADGMTVDTQGRRYLATPMGIQVFDQLGRCHLILSLPPGTNWVSNVAFGGPGLETLYATCRDKVFRRKLKARGAVLWQEPVKPPRPGL